MYRNLPLVALIVAVAACAASDDTAVPTTTGPLTTFVSDAGAPPASTAAATSPNPEGTTAPSVTQAPVDSVADSDSPPTTGTAAQATGAPHPLDEYIPPFGGIDAAESERWQRVNEDAKAACMAAEGFEYVPFVMVFEVTPLPGGGESIEHAGQRVSGLDESPQEFAAQYGYGLSVALPTDGDTRPDPNEAIVDAMSVTERVAYHQALFGITQSLDDNGYPDSEISFGDPGSCWIEGVDAAEGIVSAPDDGRAQVDASFSSLLGQIGSIYEEVMRDPRITGATQRWTECMSAAGYPGYADMNAPQSDIAERARALMGDSLDPANAEPEALAELQRLEIAVAVADVECQGDFGTIYVEVTRDHEQQFVDQHLTELEEYRDAIAALGA